MHQAGRVVRMKDDIFRVVIQMAAVLTDFALVQL